MGDHLIGASAAVLSSAAVVPSRQAAAVAAPLAATAAAPLAATVSPVANSQAAVATDVSPTSVSAYK